MTEHNIAITDIFARIGTALEALEAQPDVAKLTSDAILDNQRLADENTQLREELTRVSNELQSLQQDHIALQTTANTVSETLDDSIEQLDILMEASA